MKIQNKHLEEQTKNTEKQTCWKNVQTITVEKRARQC